MSAQKRASARAAPRRQSATSAPPIAAPASVDDEQKYAEYNGLVANADLVSVTLLRSESALHPERLKSSEDDLRINTALPEFRWGVGEDGATLHAGVRYRLQVAPENVESEPVLVVTAEYSIIYGLPDASGYSEDTSRMFVSTNAVFNGWPFFRELASSLVARMGMPPLIVPFLKLPPRPPGTGRPEFR